MKLKQIIEQNYSSHEHLVRYLDNEEQLKKDQKIKSPAHKVSVDVDSFGPVLIRVKEIMDRIEVLFEKKDLE